MKHLATRNDVADHKLYKTYWKLCLGDILFHLGYEDTPENKELLHEFHKRVLGYKSISNSSQEVLSRFITDVCIFWSVEQGIFVRTNKKQPLYIEMEDLSEVWDKL